MARVEKRQRQGERNVEEGKSANKRKKEHRVRPTCQDQTEQRPFSRGVVRKMDAQSMEQAISFLRDNKEEVGESFEGWERRGKGGNALVLVKKQSDDKFVYKVSFHRQRDHPNERLERERRHSQEVEWGKLLKKKGVLQLSACFENHITPPANIGLTCVIMENLKGHHNLNYLKKRSKPLERNQAVSLLLTLVHRMMEAMQQLGSYFVHRDIKPGNIMLEFSDTKEPIAESIRLIDWGLAYLPGMKVDAIQFLGGDEETQPREALQTTFLRVTDTEADSEVSEKRNPCIDIKLLGAVYFFLRTKKFPSSLASLVKEKRKDESLSPTEENIEPRGIKDLDFAQLLTCEEVDRHDLTPNLTIEERRQISTWVSGCTHDMSQFAFELACLCDGDDAKKEMHMPSEELSKKCTSLCKVYNQKITPFRENPAWNRRVCMNVCRKWSEALNSCLKEKGCSVSYAPPNVEFHDKKRSFHWNTVVSSTQKGVEDVSMRISGFFNAGKVNVSMGMRPEEQKYDEQTLRRLQRSHPLGSFDPSTYDSDAWTDATYEDLLQGIHNVHITKSK
mmetsp:Transcript_18179/g.45467  ORF Transcript_18179/g.45467 Transcript_18179/m.45467 type:complete len:561 (-) Transcript_18179:181-1863(-)